MHEIVIWGDGNQTRSFMYIDDCIEGVEDHQLPDRGADQSRLQELVSINRPGGHREEIAGIKLKRSLRP